jgi:hypothetical protein
MKQLTGLIITIMFLVGSVFFPSAVRSEIKTPLEVKLLANHKDKGKKENHEKEEMLKMKEEELQKREESLSKKEEELKAWENRLKKRSRVRRGTQTTPPPAATSPQAPTPPGTNTPHTPASPGVPQTGSPK